VGRCVFTLFVCVALRYFLTSIAYHTSSTSIHTHRILLLICNIRSCIVRIVSYRIVSYRIISYLVKINAMDIDSIENSVGLLCTRTALCCTRICTTRCGRCYTSVMCKQRILEANRPKIEDIVTFTCNA